MKTMQASYRIMRVIVALLFVLFFHSHSTVIASVGCGPLEIYIGTDTACHAVQKCAKEVCASWLPFPLDNVCAGLVCQ